MQNLDSENIDRPAPGASPLKPGEPAGGAARSKETEDNFRLFVESVKDYAIFQLDPEGRVASWNEGARRIKGYEASEVIGSHFSLFYTPEDIARDHPREELEIATREGRFEEEGWRVRKDGTRFWANVVITRVHDSAGKLIGFSKVTRDLTERKAAENARIEEQKTLAVLEHVNASEKTLDQIFAESPSFMVLLSVPDYRYLRTNDAHLQLIGRQNIVGKTVREVEPDLEGQGIFELLDEVVRTGRPFVGKELPVLYKPPGGGPGETRYLDFVYKPLRQPSGEIYAIAAQGYEVTEKVLSRRAVENERENFRNLFKQTPEMVCILRGPDHIFEFVNEAHIRALGFDATGKSVREAQPESVEVHGILDDVYRTGNTAHLWEIPVTLSGRRRFFNLTYAARRDDAGRINGVMVLGVEVSEQKQAEESLRNSEASFKALAESIPQMVWAIHHDGSISYRNNRWEEYTGKTMEVSRDEGMREDIHPDDFEKVMGEWAKLRRTGGSFALEYRLKGKDGAYRWFLGQAVPVKDEKGNVLQWFGTTTNIDFTKRAQLAQSFLDRASRIFSSSLDYPVTLQSVADLSVQELADWCGVDIADDSGKLKSVAVAHRDPAMVEFAREFRGKYPVDMSAPSGTPQVFRSGEPALYPEIPEALLVSTTPDPERLAMIRKLKIRSLIIVPLPGKGSNLGTLTLINSTEGRRYGPEDLSLATELARRAALAIENSRLFAAQEAAIRTRDEFLSIASHELKTPLTSLKLQAQLRARDLQRRKLTRFSEENLPRLLADDEKQVNRLVRLVEDMLDVSRLNTGRLALTPESFDLSELVLDSVSRFAPQADAADVTIATDITQPVVGKWDRLRLEQVVVNLLSNGLKYGAGKPLEVALRIENDRAVLTVEDHGIGIAGEDQNRIFGQFERAVTGTSISGLGLGLYISKKIIDAHGGRVSVTSEPGHGATFRVELPLNFDFSAEQPAVKLT